MAPLLRPLWGSDVEEPPDGTVELLELPPEPETESRDGMVTMFSLAPSFHTQAETLKTLRS
jgi:hypothetical protein